MPESADPLAQGTATMLQRQHFSAFQVTVLLLFLLVQALDGAFTYFGVTTFGPHIEGNPLVASLMLGFGEQAGLVSAKIFAGTLGVILYLASVTRIIVALTCFHLAVAVIPWAVVFW